jgi:sulfhydrogenase subunit alpha
VGSCEAPRGTLYHHYVIQAGYLSEANCIIPTGQNLANIEADMRSLVPLVMYQSQQEISHSLEMLVRAYDPCISCSTHMLQVTFV